MFDITKYKVERNPEETTDLTITKFSTSGEKSSVSISTKSFKEIMKALDMTGDQTADYLFSQAEGEFDTEEEDTGLGFKSGDEDTPEKLKSMVETDEDETHSELAYKMIDFIEDLSETNMSEEAKDEILEAPKRYIGQLLSIIITHVTEDAESKNMSPDVALFGVVRYLEDSEIFDKREIAYLVASMVVTTMDEEQATTLVEMVTPLYEIVKATGSDDDIIVLLFETLQSDFGLTIEKIEDDEEDDDEEEDRDSTIDSLLDELNYVKEENADLLAKIEAYKQRQRTLEKANNHLANRIAQIEKALKGE